MNRLDQGSEQPLTLVSAPAGSGKTTLVAAWVARRQPPDSIGWITFEAGDDRPGTFWPLVIECLARRGVRVPDDASADSSRTHRQMLTDLSACLAGLRHPLTLVLDGYEVAHRDISSDIEFVLGHCGRRLRLVILTRVDPVLPLHRFRLAETMAELRMADLAFTHDETAGMLGQWGVSLSTGSVDTLAGRTRGWAAGLRFAAMLLARSDDPDAAVGRLAGDTGNISEYLMAEILQTQPPDVRNLLLRTSVVDVLQPGLIEQLGGPSAPRRLAALARANMLVEELAEHPGWYRYHPFLRDLLRAELAYASPSRLRRLQRAAARWFADRGFVNEAVALAARSAAWTEAAGYAVEGLAVGRLVVGDDSGGLVTTLRQTPPDARGPSTSIVRAALALADNDPDRCARELARARAAIGASGVQAAGPGVELALGVVETVHACCTDDARAVTLADEASRRLAQHEPEDSFADPALTTLIQTSKGVAQLRKGEIEEARATLAAAARAAETAGSPPLPVSTLAHLALVEALQGRLRRARVWATRSVALADETGIQGDCRPPAAEIALGWVSAERHDVRAGHEHVEASLRTRGSDPMARALSGLVQARLLRSAGDAAGAIALIDDVGADLPGHARWVADLLGIEAAEAWVAQGDPDHAACLVARLHEPHAVGATLVLGHAHLKREDWAGVRQSVLELMRRDDGTPLPAAVAGRLVEVALELHGGQHGRARLALGRALRLAAPEGLRRPFREAPATVCAMLEADSELIDQNPWLGLPAAGSRAGESHLRLPLKGEAAGAVTGGAIIEPLTAKEQEVLGHLAELLTTQEIAATMFVSVNTVRTHIRSILRKLAVSRRNEAVRRARALNLIGV